MGLDENGAHTGLTGHAGGLQVIHTARHAIGGSVDVQVDQAGEINRGGVGHQLSSSPTSKPKTKLSPPSSAR